MTQKPVVLKEDIDDLHFPRGGGGIPHHMAPEEAEAGMRGSPRPEPLLGFLQENLEKAQ